MTVTMPIFEYFQVSMLDGKEAEEFIKFVLDVCLGLTRGNCLNINDSCDIHGIAVVFNIGYFCKTTIFCSRRIIFDTK